VETALELGYRNVDTAHAYDNKGAAGEALASADVDREDVFLTTKVWRATFGVFDFALEAAEMARIHDRSPGLRQRLRNGAPALMRRFLVWFSHYVGLERWEWRSILSPTG